NVCILFFQAEDGIRDFHVTGVQTCALPISGTVEAAQTAMGVTFLYWGFHAWGIYALVGLALAYFTYSLKLPLTMRSVFYPFFGEIGRASCRERGIAPGASRTSRKIRTIPWM